MKKPSVVFNDNASVAYLSNMQAAVVMESKSAPTSPIVKETGGGLLAPWGDDNLFPQNVIRECEKSTIVGPTLDWKARALYQGGLAYGVVTGYKEDGTEIFKPVIDPVVEQFLQTSNVRRYLMEATQDFYWFYNVFPEFILSKDRKKIVGITAQEASYCRWEKQNTKTGAVDSCYINANWDNGGNETDEFTTKVAVIDPYFYPVDAVRNGSAYKYIYPVSYPTPGKTLYQLAHWNGLRTSGWLKVHQSIPAFKQALFQNQITIKYLIEVSTWWWEWKFPDWNAVTQPVRDSRMSDELRNFQNFMSGLDNTGNSLMVTFSSNPLTQKEYPGWKVSAIDNKIKDGIYIEDSQEASSHLMYALGVDPTLIGNSPGKNMGAGSGSDKNAAFNVYISLCVTHQDLILEPLHFIRDYNGWNPEYQFRFRRTIMASMTSGKPTPQPAN